MLAASQAQPAAIGVDPATGIGLTAFLLSNPDSVQSTFARESRFGFQNPGFGCSNQSGTTQGREVVPVMELSTFQGPFRVGLM